MFSSALLLLSLVSMCQCKTYVAAVKRLYYLEIHLRDNFIEQFDYEYTPHIIHISNLFLATDVMPPKIYTPVDDERKVVELREKLSNVLLQNSTSGVFFCGGNVINTLYILTAAECVFGRQHDDITVYTGCQRIQQLHKIAPPVREIIIHEKYDPRDPWRNDIALLRLHICIWDLTYYVRHAPVPDSDMRRKLARAQQRLVARVSGYGILSEKQSVTTFEMLKSNTFIFNWRMCKIMFLGIYNISETQICAYDPSEPKKYKTRISDVGSPLIFHSRVVGIALNAKLGEKYPLLFTNVSSYWEWIDLQIEDRLEDKLYDYKKCSGSGMTVHLSLFYILVYCL